MTPPARNHPTPFVALALSLSVGVIGIPSPSFAAEPPAPMLLDQTLVEAQPRVALRVDTEALGSADEPMRAKILEVATDVIDSQGFAEATHDDDPRIVIVVERIGDEENPGFVVGFSIEKGDDVVPGSARQSDCSLCTRTELVERIEAELPALLELAREHQVPAKVVDGPNGDGDPGDGDGDTGEIDDRKIGPLGFAGIGLAVGGLAGVGVGVGLAVKGVEPIGPTFVEQRNYRTPGNVILAVGGAALIAGVVMIAVDVSKRKKARRSEHGSKIRPHGAGFAF